MKVVDHQTEQSDGYSLVASLGYGLREEEVIATQYNRPHVGSRPAEYLLIHLRQEGTPIPYDSVAGAGPNFESLTAGGIFRHI